MNLRRTVTAAVLTATVFAGGFLTAQALDTNEATVSQPTQATQQIQEDDPRWDCRTMGNRICGVSYAGTDYVIHYNSQGFVDMVATRDDGFTEELSTLNS